MMEVMCWPWLSGILGDDGDSTLVVVVGAGSSSGNMWLVVVHVGVIVFWVVIIVEAYAFYLCRSWHTTTLQETFLSATTTISDRQSHSYYVPLATTVSSSFLCFCPITSGYSRFEAPFFPFIERFNPQNQ